MDRQNYCYISIARQCAERAIKTDHLDTDQHQALISSRCSPLAHVYHVWVDVRYHVRELSYSQLE